MRPHAILKFVGEECRQFLVMEECTRVCTNWYFHKIDAWGKTLKLPFLQFIFDLNTMPNVFVVVSQEWTKTGKCVLLITKRRVEQCGYRELSSWFTSKFSSSDKKAKIYKQNIRSVVGERSKSRQIKSKECTCSVHWIWLSRVGTTGVKKTIP